VAKTARGSAVESIEDAQRTARRAVRNPWIERYAHFGYIAKGAVYCVMGWLTAEAAIGLQGGALTDRKGALLALYGEPLGSVLLAVLAIGLVGHGLWCLALALLDAEHVGNAFQALVERASYGLVGCYYLGLAIGTLRFIAFTGSLGNSSDTTAQDWTSRLLAAPVGGALVLLVGAGFAAVALSLAVEGVSGRFQRHFQLGTMRKEERRIVLCSGRAGLISLGIIFAIVALFFIVAALHHNAGDAKGIGGALYALAQAPFGPWLLGAIALGLLAYGAYSLAEARCRLVGRTA
jgi:hypothetical protein